MKLKVALFIFCILLLGGGVITAVAKTAPPANAPTAVTQSGRLEVLVQPGDNLYPLPLPGFTAEPVVVCSPANDAHVQTACQALAVDSGAVWVYSPHAFPVTVVVNWIADGN